MSQLPKPPKTYEEFTQRFPKLKNAWDLIGQAGDEGPLGRESGECALVAIGHNSMVAGRALGRQG